MATQNEKIKAYLEEGHSLTPIDALNLFGCFRLATRIFELKKRGMKIRTDIVENKSTGKRYASYRLDCCSADEGQLEAVPQRLKSSLQQGNLRTRLVGQLYALLS